MQGRPAARCCVLDSDTLWQAMTAEWAEKCLTKAQAGGIIDPITDRLHAIAPAQPRQRLAPLPPTRPPAQSRSVPIEPGTLFEPSATAAPE